jgi:predicted DNA binding CopG/RHH family protein
MKQKSKNTKSDKPTHEARWEEAATLFEDETQFEQIARASRVLSASEERALLGPGRTKQISIRLPEKDLQAVKGIAHATDRPYQQLVVIAVQQYVDRIASTLVKHRKS